MRVMKRAMNNALTVNIIDNTPDLDKPNHKEISAWAETAWRLLNSDFDVPQAINIAIVTPEESEQLNTLYRNISKPTNVLAFPAEDTYFDDDESISLLGELALCTNVINREGDKSNNHKAHWAHMIVHGLLHLLGHTHDDDHNAAIMEQQEIRLLNALAFDNPYEDQD